VLIVVLQVELNAAIQRGWPRGQLLTSQSCVLVHRKITLGRTHKKGNTSRTGHSLLPLVLEYVVKVIGTAGIWLRLA
jgi:hypothetical protein